MSRGDLSEAEWRLLKDLLPPERGRWNRPASDNRSIVNGILWRIRTGAPWRDVPEKYGKWMTVYQRFRRWSRAGIAKHYCKLDEPALKQLELISRNLESRGPRQLTAKNRERLRQFDDPENVAKLLAFPQEGRARGLKQKNPVRVAKCFERALAVGLFINCTLRIGTLRLIDMATDLSWVSGKCFLSIDATRVKNGQPLEFELPEDVATSLQEYIRDHRPKLAGSDGPYLFPGRDGGPRSQSTMRSDFTEVMRKRVGLVVNPHLIRHAIAKIVVERDPSLYAVISRQLGHKRMDMTMQHYLDAETRASGRLILVAAP